MLKSPNSDGFHSFIVRAVNSEYSGQCAEYPELIWQGKTNNEAAEGIQKLVQWAEEPQGEEDRSLAYRLYQRVLTELLHVRTLPAFTDADEICYVVTLDNLWRLLSDKEQDELQQLDPSCMPADYRTISIPSHLITQKMSTLDIEFFRDLAQSHTLRR